MKIKKNIAVSETGFMFNPNTGDSYSLNKTGKEIITMLKVGKSEEEIKNELTEKYDTEKGVFENDFYDFLNMLRNMNLIENDAD